MKKQTLKSALFCDKPLSEKVHLNESKNSSNFGKRKKRLSKSLTIFMILGGLLVFAFSCNQKAGKLVNCPDDLPEVFCKNIPQDMRSWYDGNTENGEIKLDVRDSDAYWDPFTPKNAPDGAPNILFVLYDDTGLGAWSPYGGKIKMPTLDSLAADGLTYTQWHTTALCSPTRSTILTGRNHHLNAMSSITESADGYPGSNGRVPPSNIHFAEFLQVNGYSTFWIGKNHNVPDPDVAPGGYRGEWPLQVGFDRFYGFLGGETNNWYPYLVEDNHFIDAPYTPEEGYHLSKDLADNAIKMLRNQNASNPSKPWYMWFCPGANHAPHHAPDSLIQKYDDWGTFDKGYNHYRIEIRERMIEKGIIPPDTELTPINFIPDSVANPGDKVIPWHTLDDKTKDLFVRMAEVYAGFSTYTDFQIGRIVDYLKESGQYENTIIVYAADNGASGEGTPYGSVNENKFFNGYPENPTENLEYIDTLGSTETYNHFPTGWAAAFATPFKMFKRYAQFAGGTNDPLVISWPKYMNDKGVKGQLRHQYHHSVDIVPTLLDAIGLLESFPKIYNGVKQTPLSGVSMFYTFDNKCTPDTPTEKEVQYYCTLGTRGIWKNGWKAIAIHAPTSGNGSFDEDVWELYHVEEDRSESKNLADSFPKLLDTLINEWYVQAAINNVLPLDDRAFDETLLIERPTSEPSRNVYRYYPKTDPVPESYAASTIGRSYAIIADVDITGETEGVILAQGSRFGGHTLYIEGKKLKYLYNFLGIGDQQYEFELDLPQPGRHHFKVQFVKDSLGSTYGQAYGTLTLCIDGYSSNRANNTSTLCPNSASSVSGKIQTQPGKFGSGEGLCIGYDSEDPVTGGYNNEKGEFINGKIHSVVVKVEGEPVINARLEARRIRAQE